jgi:hypothetical protein
MAEQIGAEEVSADGGRAEMIAWMRGTLVGPAVCLKPPHVADIPGANHDLFVDPVSENWLVADGRGYFQTRSGPMVWQPPGTGAALQEVLYFGRESPMKRYGVGLLHPTTQPVNAPGQAPPGAVALSPVAEPAMSPEELALQLSSKVEADDNLPGADVDNDADENEEPAGPEEKQSKQEPDGDDLELSPNVWKPSTMAISCCVRLPVGARLVVRLPRSRRYFWQHEQDQHVQLNGRYTTATRRFTQVPANGAAEVKEAPIWPRWPAVAENATVNVPAQELQHNQRFTATVPMADGCPFQLQLQIYPRKIQRGNDWLVTVVLKNNAELPVDASGEDRIGNTLFQSFFEVTADQGGTLQPYPESEREFAELDADEQSLALLYRDSTCWGIGHGTAAGWDPTDNGASPPAVYADVFPAVELPSMTPDINDDHGNPLTLSMRLLAGLPDNGLGDAWDSLETLANAYEQWIAARRQEAPGMQAHFQPVAEKHLNLCTESLTRIRSGIQRLRLDAHARDAFRKANLSMLLQQIATKVITHRPLAWQMPQGQQPARVIPQGLREDPWQMYNNNAYGDRVGKWRAFQVAFLLMSLDGVSDLASQDREVVDLIWFPTGGGKTEAYLAVCAYYMFYLRLATPAGNNLQPTGTNILMRYTLRMLTTQQFQRAGSLICAMEYLRRQANGQYGHTPFSLGLWVGGSASPNSVADAMAKINQFKGEPDQGNPLILTECPWCRAAIGTLSRPAGMSNAQWNAASKLGGIDPNTAKMHCSDIHCQFYQEQPHTWLPVQVIDEYIYANPPSLVIATADKLAMVAYKPEAGSLFGRDNTAQVRLPPGLIIQDELHLISGPLGTMYALYEAVFEDLCSYEDQKGHRVKPKIISSTATIRGADTQVKSLYGRSQTRLFPSPGLAMGDSFFGRYSRDADGRLSQGRLYLGIHAINYPSVQTTQVRVFSESAVRSFQMPDGQQDPWWTLLAFYNAIRELAGAVSLFNSDISTRLGSICRREGIHPRRYLKRVRELTSRKEQPELVKTMDELTWQRGGPQYEKVIDVCLATSMIEVGVDIDRLSLMAVVGQPKTTSSYIQVTGRVGRNWKQRPGLILAIYNPSKSRDRSHFEQFHSYHRRLYERVEPTSATPFALSAIKRGMAGAVLAWVRQHSGALCNDFYAHNQWIPDAMAVLQDRAGQVFADDQDAQARALAAMQAELDGLCRKWKQDPVKWNDWQQPVQARPLMLVPGKFSTEEQRLRGVAVPTSLRNVDGTAEMAITSRYEQ